MRVGTYLYEQALLLVVDNNKTQWTMQIAANVKIQSSGNQSSNQSYAKGSLWMLRLKSPVKGLRRSQLERSTACIRD